MPKFEVHLAVADRIYSLLGSGIIKNAPLFFCGNLAPDAYETKSGYLPSDKKHTHMCDGETVHSYGYGYPGEGELFKSRVNEFIKNYCITANEDRDLYLGYVVHLFTDEIYRLKAYQSLWEHLKNTGIDPDGEGFRKDLADRVTGGGYKDIFKEISNVYKISIGEYPFVQNLVKVLEAVGVCEVRDYISAEEINTFNQGVLSILKNEQPQNRVINDEHNIAVKFIDFTADEIIARIAGKDGTIKII